MRILILFSLIISLFACNKSTNTPPSKEIMAAGQKHYTAHCKVCHQANGEGTSMMNPPLANNKTVTGSPEKLTKIVLFGQSGPIKVNGKKFNGVMAPHSHLSDKQLSEILTYIRNSWGNEASAITTEQVRKVRFK
ncbi:cytochrome c [Prolixibacteraceae bacterium JC049]|nr:cytochrome c [Prolixibacteraceae bacterium JC049]